MFKDVICNRNKSSKEPMNKLHHRCAKPYKEHCKTSENLRQWRAIFYW